MKVKLKVTSKTQRRILKDLSVNPSSDFWIGQEGSLVYRCAITLVNNNPDTFEYLVKERPDKPGKYRHFIKLKKGKKIYQAYD
jgi:hypothetical protein